MGKQIGQCVANAALAHVGTFVEPTCSLPFAGRSVTAHIITVVQIVVGDIVYSFSRLIASAAQIDASNNFPFFSAIFLSQTYFLHTLDLLSIDDATTCKNCRH